MPVLGKHTLTRFLASDCRKQLRILLARDTGPRPTERQSLGMPPKQPPLPGLNTITQAGDEWAATRLAELSRILGPTVLVGTRRPSSRTSGIEFTATALEDNLQTAVPGTFLAEHQFNVGLSFQTAFGVAALVEQHRLEIAPLRPDLIEVRAPGVAGRAVAPDGSVVDLPSGDARTPLRVIDIKLTAQPGPGYFAEIVYYSVALAGWLVDHGLDDRFFVCPDPAIWPGNHDASALVQAQKDAVEAGHQLSVAAGIEAIAADLEEAPLPVFVARLRHFFTVELPEVLDTPWQDLPYHVTTRCRGCDFLGQDWGDKSGVDPQHCLPMAASTDHLSRIPFVSRGASQLLSNAGLVDVASVAARDPKDPVFGSHHSLHGQRTVIQSRADALRRGESLGLAPRSGTSAMLPRWADLNVYLTANFDASTAITLAFGVSGFWMQPTTFGVPAPDPRPREVWKARTFAIDSKSLVTEEREVLRFLRHINDMLRVVRTDDQNRGGDPSTVQFYIWDDLTYRHLCRVVGRHLAAILAQPDGVANLAWLFPPEELMPNARLQSAPAITVVGDSVRALLALPVPHYYSLLHTARRYHTANLPPAAAEFTMPHLFEDALSDQIPSERAHDIWSRVPSWLNQLKNLDWAVGIRLRALEEVTKRLRNDLRDTLHRAAPPIDALAPPPAVNRLTADELLLLAFTRLNAAVDIQETARKRAMPPHEREARFISARLRRRLTGADRAEAFARLGMTVRPDLQVYELRAGSEHANFKEGDFLCAVVPEERVDILDWSVPKLVSQTLGAAQAAGYRGGRPTTVGDVLQVTLRRLDRDRRLVVVEYGDWHRQLLGRLRADDVVNLDRNVSLEPLVKDFLSRKLYDTLYAIGRTPKAVASPVAVRALGRNPRPQARGRVPVEDVLWDALAMSRAPVARDAAIARAALVDCGRDLNHSQWAAFEQAMTHRLTLVWGPPGTGKTRTVTNVIAGAVYHAYTCGRPLRVLVSSYTYSAIDNVLDDTAATLRRLAPVAQVWRCRSDSRDAATPPVIDCVVRGDPDEALQDLMTRLDTPGASLTVVGASPQQAHKLAVACGGPTSPLFDLIIIDEASQIDVASAVLPLATLADDGAVVVAGDPLQLPPIHRIDPPVGTEQLVGSLYGFLHGHHAVPHNPLTVNYRSNAEIVALAHDADYPPGLTAHSPGLRLNILTPPPNGPTAPVGWPQQVVWTQDLPLLLDPAQPVTCVVYRDGLSGQANEFEAQMVAALTWLLAGRLADQLRGENDPSGASVPSSTSPYPLDEFFRTGVGVVTPHRAQQSRITTLLTSLFPAVDATIIRGAVDTVERFQGQQRDVMLASYAVGDPDTIADEDEFLQSLNRFNVMASRARAKVIVLVSEELIQHLPNDIEVLRASRLLKAFAETRCRHRRTINLATRDPEGDREVTASLRWS